MDELPRAVQPNTRLLQLDAHINDPAFTQAALAVLDDWIAQGLVRPGHLPTISP